MSELRVVKFRPRDFDKMAQSPELQRLKDIDKRIAKPFEKQHRAHTILTATQLAVCSFGLLQYWEGRAEAWTVLSPHCGPQFSEVHKIVKDYLQAASIARIECVVRVGFDKGHRWAQGLGFRLEAPTLVRYYGDCDYSLYVLGDKLKE